MTKEKIPVYDICNLPDHRDGNDDFLIDRFSDYLEKNYQHLQFPHRHSFFHLVFFTKGSGSHSIDFTRFDVRLFQIYFMIPGQVHSWNFKGRPDGFIINFSENFFKSFLLHPNYLEQFNFFSGIAEDGVCQLPQEVHKEVSDLFKSILQTKKNRSGNDTDLLKVLLLQLFMIVEKACYQNKNKSIAPQKQLLLKNFRRLIDAHYRTIRLPKAYADLLYITPNHLNALSQDLLGKTAGEIIRDRILLEAKRLLTNANMTVTEIAYELNFEDNSYFTRFFKKYMGLTPDAFRKQFAVIN